MADQKEEKSESKAPVCITDADQNLNSRNDVLSQHRSSEKSNDGLRALARMSTVSNIYQRKIYQDQMYLDRIIEQEKDWTI